MDKALAQSVAIDLAKVALSAARPTFFPNGDTATNIADFIDILTDRLAKTEEH